MGPSARVRARIFLLSFLTFAGGAATATIGSASRIRRDATRVLCRPRVRPLTNSGHTALNSFNRLRQSLSRGVVVFMLGCGTGHAAGAVFVPTIIESLYDGDKSFFFK